ncbi:PKD domain-containing protein [Xanthocytophaga agilis]|uniref:Uncharacterized protein n=1 Tax=Xanthocytophaga agilis TaxID=3048010 RepID=A0AAE3UJE9_9BACT|nr:hypothetical protein [Xanthocytophaga agilis]MDJ1506746.1 hypothetical protein [Xanthocytophaga agilis]
MKTLYLFEAGKLAVTTVLLFTFFAWSCEKEDGNPSLQSIPPTVNAGVDKVITLPESMVFLAGSASDSDGTVKAQHWTLVSGPGTPTLQNADSVTLSVSNLVEGTYIFRLTAVDNEALGNSDDVSVIVNPALTDPNAAKVVKITYSALDYQDMTYDDEGKIVTYYTQWQFVQNDPSMIKKITYRFHYNEAGQVKQLTTDEAGYPVNYYYKNGVLEKTEELNYKNEVGVRRYYTFEGSRLKEERWETNIAAGDMEKYTIRFDYDTKGNVIRESTFKPAKSGNGEEIYNITEYSDFDDKKNPDNALMRFPYLPGVKIHVNNPGKKVFKSANGTVISTEVYIYQYGVNRYPSQKKRKIYANGASPELTGVYSYN